MQLAGMQGMGSKRKCGRNCFSSFGFYFFQLYDRKGFGGSVVLKGDSLLAITGCQQAKDLCSSIPVTQNMTVSDAYKVLLFFMYNLYAELCMVLNVPA